MSDQNIPVQIETKWVVIKTYFHSKFRSSSRGKRQGTDDLSRSQHLEKLPGKGHCILVVCYWLGWKKLKNWVAETFVTKDHDPPPFSTNKARRFLNYWANCHLRVSSYSPDSESKFDIDFSLSYSPYTPKSLITRCTFMFFINNIRYGTMSLATRGKHLFSLARWQTESFDEYGGEAAEKTKTRKWGDKIDDTRSVNSGVTTLKEENWVKSPTANKFSQ